MRLDKFLVVSRLIKRRGDSKSACEMGFVSVNGRPAKPSKEIKPGDKIVIQFGEKIVGVEVLDLPVRNIRKDEASSLYKVVFTERLKEEKQWG